MDTINTCEIIKSIDGGPIEEGERFTLREPDRRVIRRGDGGEEWLPVGVAAIESTESKTTIYLNMNRGLLGYPNVKIDGAVYHARDEVILNPGARISLYTDSDTEVMRFTHIAGID
jgi:hypothetical protein